MIVLSGLSVHPDHGPEKIATALRADVDEIAKLCAHLAAAGFNEPTTWH